MPNFYLKKPPTNKTEKGIYMNVQQYQPQQNYICLKVQPGPFTPMGIMVACMKAAFGSQVNISLH